jgi:hypothetical protein
MFFCPFYSRLPSKQSDKKNSNDLLSLQQKVTITGLGSQAFAKSASAIDCLINVLYNSTSPLETTPLDMTVYEGHPTVTFQNKYVFWFRQDLFSCEFYADILAGAKMFLVCNRCPLAVASMNLTSSRSTTLSS